MAGDIRTVEDLSPSDYQKMLQLSGRGYKCLDCNSSFRIGPLFDLVTGHRKRWLEGFDSEKALIMECPNCGGLAELYAYSF